MPSFDDIHQRHLAAERILDKVGAPAAKSDPELVLLAMLTDGVYSLAEQVGKFVEELRTIPIVACEFERRRAPRERKE